MIWISHLTQWVLSREYSHVSMFYRYPSEEQFCEEHNDQKVACTRYSLGDAGEGFIRVSYAYSLEELKIATEKIKLF